MDLRERLYKLRMVTGQGQAEFAERLGITQSMMSFIETGACGFSREVLGRILALWPELAPDVIEYLKK